MITVHDITQLDTMKSLKLIAGQDGLNRCVTRIGFLDFEFTRQGAAYDTGWGDEFVLTSFMYALDNPEKILSGIKRLVKQKAAGVAIRNVFQFDIQPEVIRFANQNKFPVFVMDDAQLFFEDIVVEFHQLEKRYNRSEYQEKKLREILYGNLDHNAIKKNALDINYLLGNRYCIYYIRPINQNGEVSLGHLLRHGLNEPLEPQGDALIRYKDGAFLIHSQDQSKSEKDLQTVWYKVLMLDPERFRVGISKTENFLFKMRTALLQAYYACFYADLYDHKISLFSEIGVYQILFRRVNDSWQEPYLESFMQPIMDYDFKTGNELWKTLLSYERHNGNIIEAAAELFTHENTIRYRIKKIFGLFERDVNDKDFETELMVAVKLYRIQSLVTGDPKLFE